MIIAELFVNYVALETLVTLSHYAANSRQIFKDSPTHDSLLSPYKHEQRTRVNNSSPRAIDERWDIQDSVRWQCFDSCSGLIRSGLWNRRVNTVTHSITVYNYEHTCTIRSHIHMTLTYIMNIRPEWVPCRMSARESIRLSMAGCLCHAQAVCLVRGSLNLRICFRQGQNGCALT